MILAPGNVLSRVVIGLAKSSRIEKSKQRNLARHVVERGRFRARFKTFSDRCAWIARESRDNRGLACPRLTRKPHNRRDSLCACSRALRVCGRPRRVTELNLTNGLP